MDHLSLRRGAMFGGGVAVDSTRVRHLVALYRDALRALRARDMVDPAKTAIVGVSYGAAIATALAGEDRQVTALALAYPVPIRPAEFLKLITAPTLVVTPGRDRRAAAARVQFAAAVARKEIAAEFLDLPEAKVNFLARDLAAYDLADAERAWTRILAFVKDKLAPPPRVAPTPPKPPVPPPSAAPPTTPTPKPTAAAMSPAAATA